jgi:hypothetical protein
VCAITISIRRLIFVRREIEEVLSYLEVEHAGLGGGVVLLAAALLEEAVDLWMRRDC